jgi:hypothetical protein
MKKTAGIYLLIILMLFVVALYTLGVFLIIVDSSGNNAGLGTDKLINLTSLSNYTIMGGLLAILGIVFPLFVIFSLINRPTISWPKTMNIYENYYWTYGFALYANYIFLIISAIQIVLREGNSFFIPLVVLASTCSIIILNTPENQKYFAKKSKRHRALSQNIES